MPPSLDARVAVIARAFAMGPLDVSSLVERGSRAAGEPARNILPLARPVAQAFGQTTRPRVRDIIALLSRDRPRLYRLLTATPAASRRSRDEWLSATPSMLPIEAGKRWPVPSITTPSALAAWLQVDTDALAWFANCAQLGQQEFTAARHHYHYQVRRKPHGGVRILEAPQARLKAMQRRILSGILDHVPPYYSAAHGFVKGRSVHTFTSEHTRRTVLLRVDLANFFPQISRARVQAIFRTLGYPEAVADLLGGICTNTTPLAILTPARWPLVDAEALHETRRLFTRPHLPQGAPTSPALANLCAYRLDCRITGLADWAGATYSRYADDLAFSGGAAVARRIEQYAAEIGAIARDEGWYVQHHKTRVMRQGVQQRLTGLVVNTRVNVPRDEIDLLRAILTNCARHGPAGQNRQAHPNFRAYLSGRIAWVRSANVAKAERLQRMFGRIDWSR